MTKNYEDKTVLVTGTRKGIGHDVALHFLGEGARVVGLSRGPGSIHHERYNHLICDVGVEADVIRVFAEGGIAKVDILVNNAAVLESSHSLMLRSFNAEAMVRTNLLGPFFVSRQAVRLMKRANFGRIINIGSMAAVLEPVGDSVYAATKSGLVTLTNVLAREYSQFNVTCNSIGITALESDMLDQLPRPVVDAIIASLPIPRYACIEDVVNVVDFLCSPRSSYITAQAIYLGGVHA